MITLPRKQRCFRVFLAAVWAGSLFLPGNVPAASNSSDAKPAFTLFDPGLEKIVDYPKYGEFTHVGTPKYRYLIRNRDGLSKALGEGIYPNASGLLKDPAFKKYKAEGKLEGSLWDFVNSEDLQANFFKWASAQEQPGVKQFYIADMLDKAGLLTQAIKAYYASVVQFPKTAGNTFWKTPWYIGPTSLDRVAYLTREHPELGMRLEGGRVRIKNSFDDDIHNDVYEVDPGKIVSVSPRKLRPAEREDLSKAAIKQERGKGQVTLKQYDNGQWQMFVDNQPFTVRAISYSPSPVGSSPDNGSLVQYRDWQLSDINKNEKIDGPYDSWVDKNRNEKQDSDEPVVGDWKLLQDMGVNTIRMYHHAANKALFNDLFQKHGIRLMIGDFLGAYTVGSGADWYAGTDYTNVQQQEKMMESVREMVTAYKDEPYVLMWVLGNENNYGNANNSRLKQDAYYSFVNKVAKMIKSIDPNHPVALCNGDLLFMDKAAQLCPDVDLYGANAYRGNHGFGDSMWQNLKEIWKKPVFISEFGCPAYHHRRHGDVAEQMQADYLRSNWLDIEYNAAGMPGAGNAVGGVLFEFNDEWWKAGPPPQYDAGIQDIVGQFGGPFPDGWSYEEWYGIVGNGDGKDSPFKRQLRKAYFLFKDELWNPKKRAARGFKE